MAVRVPCQHHLRLAVEADGHDLPVDPVTEPQPAVAPPWRFRNSQTTEQNLRLGHDVSSLHPAAPSSGSAPSPAIRTTTQPIDRAERTEPARARRAARRCAHWPIKCPVTPATFRPIR